jgi:hypothetical protein
VSVKEVQSGMSASSPASMNRYISIMSEDLSPFHRQYSNESDENPFDHQVSGQSNASTTCEQASARTGCLIQDKLNTADPNGDGLPTSMLESEDEDEDAYPDPRLCTRHISLSEFRDERNLPIISHGSEDEARFLRDLLSAEPPSAHHARRPAQRTRMALTTTQAFQTNPLYLSYSQERVTEVVSKESDGEDGTCGEE